MAPIVPTLSFPSEAETVAFATRLAPLLRAGDTVLLSGPIGAGKSTFARALIRARLGDMAAEVPSPTFTLVQTYTAPDVDIWHCDLYRLCHPDEMLELGLDGAFGTAICLIEWPDRLGEDAPVDALDLTFAAMPDGGHSVAISAPRPWQDRLAPVLD